MEVAEFDSNDPGLINSLVNALEYAVGQIDFDVRCLDWFSWNPDYHIGLRSVSKPV